MDARVWVVIPTYNEAENDRADRAGDRAELERLVPGEHRILVVDDGSPDGTGELADGLAARARDRRSPSSPREDGPRPRVSGGLRAGARPRRRARLRDGRRLLARPALPGRAAGGSPGRRPGARLPLRRRRRGARLGPAAEDRSAAAEAPTRARSSASMSTTSRAASSASAARYSRRSIWRASAPRVTGSRSRSPTARSRRDSGSRRCRSCSATAPRHQQDVRSDRARGNVDGPGAAPDRPRRPANARDTADADLTGEISP